MRFIIIRAAVLGLLLATTASAQEWIEYSNRSDFFAINFPGEPKAKDITYVTEYAITLPAHVYSYENGRSRYSVTVVDYTNEDKLEDERVKACKAAGGEGDLCNNHARGDMRGAIIHATFELIQKSAKVTHLALSNADRVEGHELYLTNPDGTRTCAGIYMHEGRLYIIEGTVPANLPPPALFYQSIGFLDKDGKRIRYDGTYAVGFPTPRRVR